MTKLPTAAWVCFTLAFLGILATLAFLTSTKADTADFWRLLIFGSQFVGLLLGGGTVVLAGQAAKQTNGGMTEKVRDAVRQELAAQRADDVAPGGFMSPPAPGPGRE